MLESVTESLENRKFLTEENIKLSRRRKEYEFGRLNYEFLELSKGRHPELELSNGLDWERAWKKKCEIWDNLEGRIKNLQKEVRIPNWILTDSYFGSIYRLMEHIPDSTFKKIYNFERRSIDDINFLWAALAYCIGVMDVALERKDMDSVMRVVKGLSIEHLDYIEKIVTPKLKNYSSLKDPFLNLVKKYKDEIWRLEEREVKSVDKYTLDYINFLLPRGYKQGFELFSEEIEEIVGRKIDYEKDIKDQYTIFKFRELSKDLENTSKEIKLLQNPKESLLNLLTKNYDSIKKKRSYPDKVKSFKDALSYSNFLFSDLKQRIKGKNITIDARDLHLVYINNPNNIYDSEEELWSSKEEINTLEKCVENLAAYGLKEFDTLVSFGIANGYKTRKILELFEKYGIKIRELNGVDISRDELHSLIKNSLDRINYRVNVNLMDFSDEKILDILKNKKCIFDFTGLTSGNPNKERLDKIVSNIGNVLRNIPNVAMIDWGIMKDREEEIKRYRSEKNLKFLKGVGEGLGLNHYEAYVEYENNSSNTIMQGIKITNDDYLGNMKLYKEDKILLISSRKFTEKEVRDITRDKLHKIINIPTNGTQLGVYLGKDSGSR